MDLHGKVDLDAHPVADSSVVGESVPVIDIDGLDQGSAANNTVAEIAAACETWGFFQIVGHGVPADLIQRTWSSTKAFFAAAPEDKNSVRRSRDNPWGYYNNELTKNRRDKKEVFDFTVAGKDGIYGAENRWPDHDPEFRRTMLEYLDAVSAVSLRLLQAFCQGLGLPGDFLNEDFATNHSGFLRLNYYPVKDPLEGTSTAQQSEADMGVHHHTDAGALTVLLQDDIGGLQAYHNGMWHDVPPIENAFVINTGDMMQVWSNDKYQSPVHRVLPMKATDRFSLPFFYNPSANTRVAPLPSLVSDETPAHFRPIDWAEFRGKRTDGDYADYGTEVQIRQYRIS